MSAFQNVVIGLDLNESTARRLLNRACQLADPAHIEVIHTCDNLHDHHHSVGAGDQAGSHRLSPGVLRYRSTPGMSRDTSPGTS